jgi:7,8-dihydropterin-6-yl-methyl-4-(beta-D-ribofuranosyl)aminobenzene 5'-phosphate synthase
MLKVTIISDNTVYKPGLKKEWGFACLVEAESAPKILFDTGASGSVLLHNMERLEIDFKAIDCVFISHNHWDHTGGLKSFLKLNSNVRLYLPYSFSSFTKSRAAEVIRVKEPIEIYDNVFSTGQLNGIEHSMVVRAAKGLVIIAGCSHPGVGDILNSARQFGNAVALIGGLHGFNDFDLVEGLDLICATHCTQHKERIKELYPDKYIEGGAGRKIVL